MSTAPTLPSLLVATISRLTAQFEQIDAPRKQLLESLSAYIRHKKALGANIRLVVICTHNSRRSHMGQLWLAAAARYYQISGIETFSGGTEATAFNPRAVAALQEAGFPLVQQSTSNNPIYHCQWESPSTVAIDLFSKKVADAPNPPDHFAAILVCSQADKDCPLVVGAEVRFSIPYEDPKNQDGTPFETAAYRERVEEIGRDFLYVLAQVNV